MSTCRSCQAPIRWATTARGKAMPLDPRPTSDGNVVLDNQGAAVVLADEALAAMRDGGVPLFTSHFATCPNANEHRRAR